MNTSSREVVTLMLLQEERAETITKAKALRKQLTELENAVAHIDLAIVSIKSSPLSEALDVTPKALLSHPDHTISVRPGLITRLLNPIHKTQHK